jgi:hypothetical protein
MDFSSASGGQEQGVQRAGEEQPADDDSNV